MNDKLWIALFLFATFADQNDFKMLETESFDDDFDEMLHEFESEGADEIKNKVIDFIKSYKDKARKMNEAYRKTKNMCCVRKEGEQKE
jgi:hypothetical protein